MRRRLHLFLCIMFFLVSSITSFSRMARARFNSSWILMNSSFGVQKLGERVLDPEVEAGSVESEGRAIFQPGSIGSGNDERVDDVTAADLISEQDQINRIDKSFRQQALMMALGDSSQLGLQQKQERVHMAAAEGLLPATYFGGEGSVNVMAASGGFDNTAGLKDDWDFDM